MEGNKGKIVRTCSSCSFNICTQDGSMKAGNKCFCRDFPKLFWIFPVLDSVAFLISLNSLNHIKIQIFSCMAMRNTQRTNIQDRLEIIKTCNINNRVLTE